MNKKKKKNKKEYYFEWKGEYLEWDEWYKKFERQIKDKETGQFEFSVRGVVVEKLGKKVKG